MKSSILIISHAADWDGMFSAAIIHSRNYTADIILRNYDDPEPIEEIETHDVIYLTDMSLSIETMRKYASRIVYIDHHAAKIAEVDKEIGLGRFKRYFVDTFSRTSAAELAWEYAYSCYEMPLLIRMISVYDVFAKSDPLWNDAYALQFGLRKLEMTPETAEVLMTDYMEDSTEIDKLIVEGNAYLKVKSKEALEQFEKYGFPVTLHQDGVTYHAVAILTSEVSSTFSNPIIESGKADIVLMINRHDNASFRMSVRVADKCNFDACRFCNTFGGGGHKPAAGCKIGFNVFESIFKYGII